MSKTLTTFFEAFPGTHAEANGHWNRASVIGPNVQDQEEEVYADIHFQNGPVQEHGVNGVQLPQILRICLARYQMLNESFPCRENSLVITRLQEAIMWDEERTAKRTRQGVEGYDKPHKDEETA